MKTASFAVHAATAAAEMTGLDGCPDTVVGIGTTASHVADTETPATAMRSAR